MTDTGWRGMTSDDGKPRNENLGYRQAFESDTEIVGTLKECYGMIWYLAVRLDGLLPSGRVDGRRAVLELIEEARRNAKIGIAIGISER